MTRPPRTSAAKTTARAAFTLIEMMAVVALIGMIFAVGLPRLSNARWRALGEAADSIAASLEFARQRAIMTGVPHRVLVDLEDGGWRVEWLVSETAELAGGELGGGRAGALAGGTPAPEEGAEPDPNAPIDLHPPQPEGLEYQPVANRQLGAFSWLDPDDRIYFVGLESPSGWIESGDVQIVFEADGTTDFVLLELADDTDRHMTLEIEPMLERVRRRDGPARS